MGSFVGQVELTPVDSGDGRSWQVDKAFEYESDEGKVVQVPEGFQTDLASIPRPLWIFWPPEGLYTDAAVVHDCCYAQQIFSRLECDQILMEAMKDLGVSWWTRHVIYAGVRVGGWVAWNAHLEHNLKK